MVKSEALFRGNYAPPVLVRKYINTKSGLLPYFSAWVKTFHRHRISELKETLDEDDDGYDDNYQKQLLRPYSHMELLASYTYSSLLL